MKSVTSTLEDRWVTEGTTAPTRARTATTAGTHEPAVGDRPRHPRQPSQQRQHRGRRNRQRQLPANFTLPDHRHGHHRTRQHGRCPASTRSSSPRGDHRRHVERLRGAGRQGPRRPRTTSRSARPSPPTARPSRSRASTTPATRSRNAGVIMPLPRAAEAVVAGRRRHLGHRHRRQRRPPRRHRERAAEDARRRRPTWCSDATRLGRHAVVARQRQDDRHLQPRRCAGRRLGDHLPEHADDRAGATPGDRRAQGDRLVERQDLVAVRHRGAHPHRHGRGRRASSAGVDPRATRCSTRWCRAARARRAVRPARPGPGGGPGGAAPAVVPSASAAGISRGFTQFGDVLSNVQATVGFGILLYGLLAAVADRGRRHRVPVVADRQGPARRSHEDGVVMLQVTDLSKTFGSGDTEVKAVDGVSFTVPTGVLRRRRRPQRQRQEHVALVARRARQADERHHRGRRRGHQPAAATTS